MHRLAAGIVICLLLLAPTQAQAQIRKPPAIEAKSVPAIASADAERLAQYQDFRSADFAGWAPDGRGMLISTRFGNTAQLFRVYEPEGRREQVTFFSEPAGGRFLGGVAGGTSGDLLASLNPGGSENYQIYFVNAATGQRTLLTDGKSRNGLGPVRKDGSRMIVHSNLRNGKDSDLYIADPRKPDSMTLILEGQGESYRATSWSHDGFRLLVLKYISINESYPFQFDVLTRKLTPLPLVHEKPAAYTDLTFSLDGKSVYLAVDARGEYREFAVLNLESGQYTFIPHTIKGNVESIEAVLDGAVFAANEDGVSSLYRYRSIDSTGSRGGLRVNAFGGGGGGLGGGGGGLGGGAAMVGAGDENRRNIRTKAITPSLDQFLLSDAKFAGSISGLELNETSGDLGFTFSPGNGPSEAYSLGLQSGDSEYGNFHRWTISETGGIPASKFVSPQLVRFKSFDGLEIPAFVYKPAAKAPGKRPVVVMIHGGPESQYRPRFSPIDQYIVNELGYAVVWPNVRGSDGYGKKFLLLDNGAKREDSVKDVGALLDWVKAQPDLDATRVAVMGGSYGGYMTLACLTNFPDRFKAGVDIVGIASFTTFLERTAAYRRDLRRAEYGDERDPQMKAVFDRINPLANAGKIKSALMVVHGKNDPRVPFFEAEQIAAKVREAGKPVWTVYAEDEGHGFAKKENRDYMNNVIVAFLKEHLK